MKSSEEERVALLRALFGASDASVAMGIGDDCAILHPVQEPLVWSIDAAVEGVHFRRDRMGLRDIGYRATMAALSDIAAMGARGLGVIAGLTLPPDTTDEELRALASGQREAATRCGVSVVGGNMTGGALLSITTSVLGACAAPLLRSGARAGDQLLLGGDVGLARVGLALVLEGRERTAKNERAFEAFLRPRARLEEGQLARVRGAHAACDVSDGLATDAAHLAEASGVTIVLEEAALLAMAPPELHLLTSEAPLDAMLRGGEDYALLVSAKADLVLPGFVRVGRCEPRMEHALLFDSSDGRRPIGKLGFDHFRSSV